MSNKYYQAGKQAYNYMKQHNMKGTKKEIIDILKEKGVQVSEMRETMLKVMNYPFVSTMLKALSAPVDNIKKTLNFFDTEEKSYSSKKSGSLSSRIKNL